MTRRVYQPRTISESNTNLYAYPETNKKIFKDVKFKQSQGKQNFNGVYQPNNAPAIVDCPKILPVTLLHSGSTNLIDATFEDYINNEFKKHFNGDIPKINSKSRSTSAKPNSNANSKKNIEYLNVNESINLVTKRNHVLISIDNEFFEFDTTKVTEIGISIYNPTYQKYSLFPHIINFHFIVEDYLPLRNGNYVPDNKMANITGESYIINLKDIPKALNYIFESLGNNKILVGHNVKGDIESFKFVNWTIPPIKVMDTMSLWTSLFGKNISIKSRLSFILEKLGIPSAYLHNGVNDAYYTLVAALMLCSIDLRNNLKCKIESKLNDDEIESNCGDVKSHIDAETNDNENNKDKNIENIENLPDVDSKEKSENQKTNATSIINKSGADQTPNIRLRCEISDTSISRKHPSSKLKHPPSNEFFKPVFYDEDELLRKLNELKL
ncbi:hypothetical protein DAMA08_052480 [Martiniozyma asiatica (nom. inval.)]|nr:hypothetical protein DAMA08_052480 [Martiniozyma asiatica]